jgi:response regulator RpfG family c-di-GMP phosphodiesterase
MDERQRILFIDDEEPVRIAFRRTLRQYGFDVHLAATLPEALAAAGTLGYAVFAADYRMPGCNGLTVLAELEKLQPSASLMLVSGACDLALAVEAINQHGITSIVIKPWDGPELANLVRRAVAAHEERVLQAEVQKSACGASRALEEQKRKLESALVERGSVLAERLLGALDLRHHETRAHCQRVCIYARMLAGAMGLVEPRLTEITQGALLHDLGKIGVPDEILLKPGPLTPEEWSIMRQHSAMGAKLLDGLEGLDAAREIVLQHHERWDGAGYPNGLAGEAIGIGARIFSVCDAVDAMLAWRPYRKPLAIDVVVGEIRSKAGTQFDPRVIAVAKYVSTTDWVSVQNALPDCDLVADPQSLTAATSPAFNRGGKQPAPSTCSTVSVTRQ